MAGARTGAIAMNRAKATVRNGAADCEWGLGIMVRAIPEGFGRIGKFTDGCGRRKSCSAVSDRCEDLGVRNGIVLELAKTPIGRLALPGKRKTPIGRYIPRKARDGEALAFPGVAAIAKMAVRCENGCGVKD